MNPTNGQLIGLAPGVTGFETAWIDTQRASSITLNARWNDAITAKLIIEGTDSTGTQGAPGSPGPFTTQYSLPAGCLHTTSAGVVLAAAFTAGEGVPVVLTPAGAGKLIVSLAFQSRWLRCRLVRTAGGGAADWYIFYTMRLYQ